MKCGVISDKKLLISIIRRFDMDSDARLSKEEFIRGIMPIEKFTKSSLYELKSSLMTEPSKAKRVKSAV